MRRENRRENRTNSNTLMYISGGILAVAVIAFVITFIVYSNRLNSNSSGVLDTQFLSSTEESSNTLGNTAEASSKIGKSVEESKNQTVSNQLSEEQPENEYTDVQNNTKQTVSNESSKVKDSTNDNNKKNEKSEQKEEKEPEFESPIENAEIAKEFASDSLVYSETLKEWVTHLGIDIKADKATVVKAAEDGVVKAIKNDPRYGLTVIIEHNENYQTLYANLLTSEFVSEGEKVKKGQTIGTVGDTAVYEIVDAPHLHFEIIKHGVNQNPVDYIKF